MKNLAILSTLMLTGDKDPLTEPETEQGVKWYKSLSLDQKMGLKECAHLLTGMRWEQFSLLFSPRERLQILYEKLKLEGFEV